jgi:hypothetical protein
MSYPPMPSCSRKEAFCWYCRGRVLAEDFVVEGSELRAENCGLTLRLFLRYAILIARWRRD